MGRQPLWALAAALLPPTAAVAALFAFLSPEPYMDEPFHVPQTQRFCEGRWTEWDHKITTFPGLYLFGVAAGRLEAAMARLALGPGHPRQLCSTTALRSVNLVFAAACLPLFCACAARLGLERRSRAQLALMTAAAFLFPLHYFFAFLYYTDVPSLFFTLACHLAAQHRLYRLAGVLGALAVLMRQTNAVWVAFVLAEAAIERCLPEGGEGVRREGEEAEEEGEEEEGEEVQQQQQGRRRGAGGSRTAGGGGQQQESRGGVAASAAADGRGVVDLLAALPGELAQLARRAWVLKWQLAAELWPLAAVVAAFAAFVVVNGGIVVGDRASHAAVRHWAQPLYCLLYCTAWLAPALASPTALRAAAAGLATSLRRRPAATAAALASASVLTAAAIRSGTLAHPYLLADNRHFTFYLWRRLVNRTLWSRYALLPAYLYSAWAACRALAHRRPAWVAALAGATAAVLVPAHLIEFRYFTVPFYLLFLHMRAPGPRALAAIVALFAAANAAAIYLFLARPFAWPDGSTARFLW